MIGALLAEDLELRICYMEIFKEKIYFEGFKNRIQEARSEHYELLRRIKRRFLKQKLEKEWYL
jgi:hypothetical protein